MNKNVVVVVVEKPAVLNSRPLGALRWISVDGWLNRRNIAASINSSDIL